MERQIMSPEKAWKATLGELELQMTKATFNTWLKDAQLLACDDGEYIVGVRNDYARDWLENRLNETIVRTLSTIVGSQVSVRFVVWSDALISPPPPVLTNGTGEEETKPPAVERSTNGHLNNRYTFATGRPSSAAAPTSSSSTPRVAVRLSRNRPAC